MSDQQAVLTEKRGKALDKWIEMKCIRLMSGLTPVSPTLADLPSEIIEQVLKKMEQMDRLPCRKVCRNLKYAVDELGFHLEEVELRLGSQGIILNLDNHQVSYSNLDGCSIVTLNKREPTVSEENFMNLAIKDLELLSKHTSRLCLRNVTGDKDYNIKFLTDALEASVQVKKLIFWSFSFNDLLWILPYFNAEDMEFNNIHATKIKIEWITYLKQWKQATTVSFSNFTFGSHLIEHFFHFERFTIKMEDFPVESAVKIRDNLMKRSTFNSCLIEFHGDNRLELARVFKPDFTFGICNFDYLNDNDTFGIKCTKLETQYFLFSIVRFL